MSKAPIDTERLDQTNLAALRTSGAASKETAAIPAVDRTADRRSDRGNEVGKPALIAPQARTSRRGFLMNTAVSLASLASAIPVATSPATAGTPMPAVGELSFPDLIAAFIPVRNRFLSKTADDDAHTNKLAARFFEVTGMTNDERVALKPNDPRWDEANETFKAIMDEIPNDDPCDENGHSIEWNEIMDALDPAIEPIIAQTPRSLADLAWQAEAVMFYDCELLHAVDRREDHELWLLQQLVRRTQALAGPLLMPAGGYAACTSPPLAEDPIFAAIEAHRQANAVYRKAIDGPASMLGTHRTARVCVGYNLQGEFSHEKINERVTWTTDGKKLPIYERDAQTLTWTPTGEKEPLYASSLEDIERSVPRELHGADRDTWIANRRAELETEEKRIARNHARSKLGRLEAKLDEAYGVERDRMWDLIWTAPSTIGGLTALLQYCRENESINELVHQDEWEDALEWTIECAVCALAGLPKPPMDEVVASLWNESTDEQAA